LSPRLVWAQEFGRIAELVQTAEEEETPLQKKLDRFAKQIAKAVLILCAIIFVLEVFAEGFAVAERTKPEPGTVLVIDPAVTITVSASSTMTGSAIPYPLPNTSPNS
jgi:magnesium-transporting ATPase (P-type)